MASGRDSFGGYVRKRFKVSTAITAISLVTLFTGGAAQAQISSDFDLRFSQDFNYSWDFTGGGARAAGMGNAFTAVSDGPFSLAWNPAGMVDLDEIYFSFDWMDYIPKGSYDFNGIRTFDHSGSTGSFFRNAALISPTEIKKHKFVLGLGVTRHFDTYDFFAEKIFPHPSSPDPVDLTSTRQGYLNSGNFSFSTAVSEKFSVGVTANIYFGRVIVDQFRNEVYQSQVDSANFNQVVEFRRNVRQLDSLNLSGFNFNIGGKYRAGEFTTFGLNIRTPFKIKLSDDIILDRIVTKNGAIVSTGLTSTDTLIWADQESKIEMPLMVTFGAAHKWTEKFLTSLDLEYRGFSGSDFLLLDSTRISQAGTKESFFRNEPSHWNNVFQVRMGGEYTIDSKIGEIPLRAGFGYLPQPFSDISNYSFTFNGRQDPLLPVSTVATGDPVYVGSDAAFQGNQDIDLFQNSFGSQVTATSFSLGFGIHSPQRTLDIAYSFTSYTQQVNTSSARGLISKPGLTPNTYDPGTTADATPYLGNISHSSETKVRDHRIMISFTGYF